MKIVALMFIFFQGDFSKQNRNEDEKIMRKKKENKYSHNEMILI